MLFLFGSRGKLASKRCHHVDRGSGGWIVSGREGVRFRASRAQKKNSRNTPSIIKCFSMFLKASCTASYYHPNDLGLLFLKDSEGKTACERASKNYGNDKTMAAIGDIIPFDDPT